MFFSHQFCLMFLYHLNGFKVWRYRDHFFGVLLSFVYRDILVHPGLLIIFSQNGLELYPFEWQKIHLTMFHSEKVVNEPKIHKFRDPFFAERCYLIFLGSWQNLFLTCSKRLVIVFPLSWGLYLLEKMSKSQSWVNNFPSSSNTYP